MSKKASQNNKANQMNPNNPAYYQARGMSTRPKNWSETLEKKCRQGQLENRANNAAALSKETRRAIGSDTQRVEKVAKQELGPHVQVYKGGSQYKRTNISYSDNDLKIKVDRPITRDDRARLGKGLEKEFGKRRVDRSGAKVDVSKDKEAL